MAGAGTRRARNQVKRDGNRPCSQAVLAGPEVELCGESPPSLLVGCSPVPIALVTVPAVL